MKKILLILFVLLVSPVVFAQTEAYKFADYEELGVGCDEGFRIFNFAEKIKEKETNQGLIVVYYKNDEKEKFGNILAYSRGVKDFLSVWLGIDPKRISVAIAEGEKSFSHEFWVIPKNAELPKIKPYTFDWGILKSKYHFSSTCFQCEPSYPMLTSFQGGVKEFSEILLLNKNYKGQIVVNDYTELRQIKEILTVNQKLPLNRYSIQIRKKKKGQEDLISVDLYLIPNSNDKRSEE